MIVPSWARGMRRAECRANRRSCFRFISWRSAALNGVSRRVGFILLGAIEPLPVPLT